ncbi:GPR1/FUN34/YaaH-class plasma membrane protein [Bimuria novae-zelandiae CBS 107.79]|uniref:GPR1/FUN34/YaaH-class plasma membrane protein n=1 Tax=Bimuria novae-zelandiae CBS 107.79 TaxID=1447943 RepID=A0A6A5VKK4_9PLEO|nr:GPR1/FUN34/YaaH-class plasma membrane protein [Bimuria novae-zelandiae CBS 107.79]
MASTISPTLEKDFSSGNSTPGHIPSFNLDYQTGPYSNGYHQHLDASHDSETALRKMRTAGSISITPELFEKLYLSPQNKVHGDLRKTFGNPTPLAIIGFLICLTPLSICLMGWRGSGGSGASGTGTYYFFGGLLMTIGSLGEFIIGNTFPFVVFGSFGAFWLGWAATLQPFYNAYGAYSTTGDVADGLTTIGFRSSYAFFFLAMGMLCFIYMICALRTNIVFFLIFLTLLLTFVLLAATYWHANNGNMSMSHSCQVAAGACAFVASLCGWWMFTAIMLASLDFPFSLPVGDLSGVIKGASQKRADENV